MKNIQLFKDNKNFRLKRVSPNEWKDISKRNNGSFILNTKEELSKWNFKFNDSTVKLSDIPEVKMKSSQIHNFSNRNALSPQPKMRTFLYIDNENLNFEKVFNKVQDLKKAQDLSSLQSIPKNDVFSEESVVSPNRTNYEVLKRLMSMYSQKKPAIHQLRKQLIEKSDKNCQNLPHLNLKTKNEPLSPVKNPAF